MAASQVELRLALTLRGVAAHLLLGRARLEATMNVPTLLSCLVWSLLAMLHLP